MKRNFFTFLFFAIMATLSTTLSAQAQDAEPLSPYIEDSRAIQLEGIQVQNTQQSTIEINGETYQWFATREEALDYFKNMNQQFDFMKVYINDVNFGMETYEIRRKILRKSYYNTPMEREIFTMVQVN